MIYRRGAEEYEVVLIIIIYGEIVIQSTDT